MSEGIRMIADERKRQVESEGWTLEHDAEHVRGELADASIAYAKRASMQVFSGDNFFGYRRNIIPSDWPYEWDKDYWKPSPDPIRNLIKAGALIAAEIDRILAAHPNPTAAPTVPSHKEK